MMKNAATVANASAAKTHSDRATELHSFEHGRCSGILKSWNASRPRGSDQAQHHPDAPAVADHDRGQRLLGADLLDAGRHSVQLFLERLSVGKAPGRRRRAPTEQRARAPPEPPPRTGAPPSAPGCPPAGGQSEAHVETPGVAATISAVSRSPAQVRGPDRGDALPIEVGGQRPGLPAAVVIQRRVGPALKAQWRPVVVRSARGGPAGRRSPRSRRPPPAIRAGTGSGQSLPGIPIVSERRPSRSVSRAKGRRATAMFPTLTSGPNRLTNHTCWSLRGASNRIDPGSISWTISSISPSRTSPGGGEDARVPALAPFRDHLPGARVQLLAHLLDP